MQERSLRRGARGRWTTIGGLTVGAAAFVLAGTTAAASAPAATTQVTCSETALDTAIGSAATARR